MWRTSWKRIGRGIAPGHMRILQVGQGQDLGNAGRRSREDGYGASAPAGVVLEKLGNTAAKVVFEVKRLLKRAA